MACKGRHTRGTCGTPGPVGPVGPAPAWTTPSGPRERRSVTSRPGPEAADCPNLPQRPVSSRNAQEETLIFRAFLRGQSRRGAPLWQIWTRPRPEPPQKSHPPHHDGAPRRQTPARGRRRPASGPSLLFEPDIGVRRPRIPGARARTSCSWREDSGVGAGAAVRGPEATGSVAEAGACVVVSREVAPGARPVVAEQRSTGRRGTVLCDMPSRCRAGVWLASAPVVCSL